MKLLVFLLLPCLSLSEVGEDFSKCKQFFLNNGPPEITQRSTINVPPLLELDSTAHICQCLMNDNGQPKYLYATLYNTAWRIPVYSAYVFGSPSTGRKDYWYIEPQLDGVDEPCMGRQEQSNPDIGNNQALNRDYDKSGYDKGHLYPVQHTDNPLSMRATSTLTNAAPQAKQFNQHAWKKHEEKVIKALKDCDKAYKAYVVTGVVPDLFKNINNRVRVSKYYWRATCCVKNGVYTGQGYYGPDKTEVKPLSITALQEKLAIDYGVNFIIFPGVPKPSDSC